MWLALDTASDRASVALGEPGGVVLEAGLAGARRHAAALLPMIDGLLRQAGLRVGDLAGVAVSDGPGSFTGLRVGAAAAKALAHASRLPLRTAPSLQVRAAGVARPGALVLAVSDALRGELFAAAYRFDAAGPIGVVLAPTAVAPAALAERMPRPDAVVGELPPPLRESVERWAGSPLIGPPDGAPRAARLVELVGREGGVRVIEDPAAWEPTYGRPAEAQARWELAHGRPLPDTAGRPR